MLHGPDLARGAAACRALGAFVAARGLARSPPLAESAAALLIAALVVLSWFGVGAMLRRLIERGTPGNPAPTVAVACALGAVVWSLAWFGLGVLGAYQTTAAVIALGIGLSLAVTAFRRTRGGPPRDERPNGPDAETPNARSIAVPLGLVMIAVTVAGVAALAPPTAKDALQYHLALPKAFAAARGLIVVPGNIASYFPLAVETNGLWAMLIGNARSPRVGEAAFGATTFAFLPILLVFVYGWARELGATRAWAATAATVVGTAPVVYEVAASAGYVDVALALYVAIAARAAVRWWVLGARADLAVLAIAAGGAIGVKMPAIFTVVALVPVALLGARRARAGVGVVVAAFLGAIMLGAPWYVRTWWLTGTPFFPFFLDLWPGAAPGWDVARSVMYRAFNTSYGGEKDLLGYIVLPVRLAVMGQREAPAFYESTFGVAFLVALPIIAWAAWRRVLDGKAVITGAIAAVLFVWWATTGQVARYLIPAMPLIAVLAARAASSLEKTAGMGRWLQAAMLLPAAAGLALLLAWFLADAPMLPVLGTEPREEYLTRRLDYYPYYRVINSQLPADARVWLIDVRRDTYHLERAYHGDYLFEDYTLQHAVSAGSDAEGLRQLARAAGTTHVFMRHDALFDYARSPLVEDRLPRSENETRLSRVREFLTQGTSILKADQKFALVELPR